MSSPLLGASDFDLDALDAFLMSDRAPEDCMQLSDLDGFLAGIAIGPLSRSTLRLARRRSALRHGGSGAGSLFS